MHLSWIWQQYIKEGNGLFVAEPMFKKKILIEINHLCKEGDALEVEHYTWYPALSVPLQSSSNK